MERDNEPTARGLSRRAFLLIGGAGVLAAGLPSKVLAAVQAPAGLTLDLFRPEDMLKLRFEFHNLVVSHAEATPKLVRQDPGADAYVVVQFGSQHLMERAVGAAERPAPGELPVRAVEPSRIVFVVPQTVKSFPYTEDGLLAWWQWVMRVPARAVPPGGGLPAQPAVGTKPAELETDLLLVDWLHVSPDSLSTWSHSTGPVTTGGRTGLWHTTLALRGPDGRPARLGRPPTLRAISADPVGAGQEVFNVLRPTSVTDAPELLVRQTTDPAAPGNAPASAELVLLSAAGASVDLEGHWSSGTIASWQHRAALGRDNFVRIVARGYLYPFGHRAVLVTDTEREIVENGVAYLRQEQYILVREPVKNYPDQDFQPNDGRQFPFTRIRLTTPATPTLPANRPPVPGSTGSFWIPGPGGVDLPFAVEATELTGRIIEFTTSLAFIREDEAHDAQSIKDLVADWSSYDGIKSEADPDRRRVVDLSGQQIALAVPIQPGNTSFPVTRFFFGAERNGTASATMKAADLPNFFPTMMAAEAQLPAVAALTGEDRPATVALDPGFVTTAPAARAETDTIGLYARTAADVADVAQLLDHLAGTGVQAPQPLSAGLDPASVGAVAVPELAIGGLSQLLGPVSGTPTVVSDVAAGRFNPADYFDLGSTVLGDIVLSDILQSFETGGAEHAPRITTRVAPEAVETTLEWTAQLQNQPGNGPFEARGAGGRPAGLTLRAESRIDLKTGERTSKVTGVLRDFTLHLIDRGEADFIDLVFDRFVFEQHNDAKPTFDPTIADVVFAGPLKFINPLRQYLSPLQSALPGAIAAPAAAAPGPNIDVRPDGVGVGYTLAIPDVAVGAFALQNLSFSAGIELPFDGNPVAASFAFSSPENRFGVTVYGFSGGGFFALELSTRGLQRLEAAIEFGGNIALDLFVASGSVTVMAGVYFGLERTDGKDELTLAAYLRAVGRLSVLGLITITAEFYLALEYKDENGDNALEGEAVLAVTVELFIFSKTVRLRVRKRFNGPDIGPGARSPRAALTAGTGVRFGDLMSQSDWTTYCDAFAA